MFSALRFRHSLLGLVAVLAVFSQATFAFPDADEMRQNYNFCVQSDEYWHQRFGQYIVAFDIDSANRICSQASQRSQVAACRVDGQNYYAGYYCVDMNRDL